MVPLWDEVDFLEGNVLRRDKGYVSVYQPVKIMKLIFVCFHVNMHCFKIQNDFEYKYNIGSNHPHTVSREYKDT